MKVATLLLGCVAALSSGAADAADDFVVAKVCGHVVKDVASLESAAAGCAEAIDVKMRGVLKTGVMAIGAETTGVTITAGGATWELELDERQSETAASLAGKPVTVEGSLRYRRGVEVKRRAIVKVRRITP
jgi:hypothetical protein